jgi:DNA-binding CsgD family transcriptional regulator
MKCEELVSAIGLLTKRELELMRELVSGNVSKDLANKLNISVYTLETHKKNIFRKLEINSIGELINIAHKYRIVA